MNHYRKLIVVICFMIFFSMAIQVGRTYQSSNYTSVISQVVLNDQLKNAIAVDNNDKSYPYTLIIYDNENSFSTSQAVSVSDNLSYLKVDYELFSYNELVYDSIDEYDIIIYMINDMKYETETLVDYMFNYVEKGGRLLFGMVTSNLSETFVSTYRKMGIDGYLDYLDIESFHFIENLMPSTKGRHFDDEAFNNVALNVSVNKNCKVYLQSSDDNDMPLYWTIPYGEGKIGVNNYGDIGNIYSKGLFVGEYAALLDDFVYPIINASVLFIDDFPSPQYSSIDDRIYSVYNRNVKEFYRDIWWPDMQSVARKNNQVYTGLFVSSYDDIVNPTKFSYEVDKMIKYYGESLRRNHYELGLHGYNHQPLALVGQTPSDLEYNGWASINDMQASISTLISISDDLFLKNKYKTYVPPSNYLSAEGRIALINAMPDLKVISGVYTKDDNAIQPYVQRFEVADDGIVEFPRMTSGMFADDFSVFTYLNGLALHGVFSHFIHPDDILDEERGRGVLWTELFEDYTKILEDIGVNFQGIRALSASDAGDATKAYDMLEINIAYADEIIKVACNNFAGEAYFYLRTDKKPLMYDNSYEVINLNDNENSYYLIKAKKAYFEIKLEV